MCDNQKLHMNELVRLSVREREREKHAVPKRLCEVQRIEMYLHFGSMQ